MIILLLCCASIGILSALLIIVGVSLYEIISIRRANQFAQKVRQPKVALVMQYHDKSDFTRALNIAQIPYKKLTVILINQTGKSQITRVVRKNGNKKIVVFSSKKPFAHAVVQACKKHGQDGTIITLGKHMVIDAISLDAAISHLAKSSYNTALLNRYYITHFSIGGLLQSYLQSLEQLSLKTRDAFRLPIIIYKDEPVIYRSINYLQQDTPPTGFIADSTAFVEYGGTIFHVFSELISQGVTAWQLLKSRTNAVTAWLCTGVFLLQQLALFMAPLVFGYFVFVALRLHQPTFLLAMLALVFIVAIYAIWSDSQLALYDKLLRLLQLPVMYLLLPVLFVLPLVTFGAVLLKVLANMTKAKVPVGVGLFMRVKDILRIV